tara:strand:- start:6372 stop:6752 length:381 start_codon:yes stop_codon:yes gene_type:complete
MKIDNILVDNDNHGNNPVLTRRIKNLVTGSEKIMDVVLIDYFDEYVDIQVYLDDYRHPITRESAMRFECQNDDENNGEYRDTDIVINEIEKWLEEVQPDNLAKDENGDSLYDHFGQWNGTGKDPNY